MITEDDVSDTTIIRKKVSETSKANFSKLFDVIKDTRQDINTEFRAIRLDINRLDEKFIEVIINQNNNDHKFESLSNRVAPLERAIYGTVAFIVTAVISALLYTVIKK